MESKSKCKSKKYKGVYKLKTPKNEYGWSTKKIHKHRRMGKFCKTEREAAIAYDVILIELGLEPVNILKRK